MRLLGPGVELELVGRSLARKDGSAPHILDPLFVTNSHFCRRCKDLASYLGLPNCEKREEPKGSPKPRKKDLSSYLGVGQDVLCTVVAPEPPEPQQCRKGHPSQSTQAAQSSHANQDNLKPRSPPPPPSSSPPPPRDASPSAPSPASSVLPLPIRPHLLNTLHPSSEPPPTSLPRHPTPPPPPLDTLPPTADIDTDYSWGTEVDSAFSSAASSEYSTIYL